MSRLVLRRPLWGSLLDDPWSSYSGPWRLFDQYLGETITDDEIAQLAALGSLGSVMSLPLWHPAHVQSHANRRAGSEHGTSLVEYNDSQFKVNVDIRQFKPEEVNVKLVDNRVVIHARHEEREDQHGLIKREFTRSYVLPKDVDSTKLEAKLSDDGTLRISAPRHQVEKPKETVIPIKHDANANANAGASASGNTQSQPQQQ